MRYEIGNADLYETLIAGSCVDCAPMMRIELKEVVNKDKLHSSVCYALKANPLFATKVMYKHRYFLESNDAPIIIDNIEPSIRPKEFGKRTNGYPFQVCYWENIIAVDFFHGIAKNIVTIIRTDKLDRSMREYKQFAKVIDQNGYSLDDSDAVIEVRKTKGRGLGFVCLKFNKVSNSYYECQKAFSEEPKEEPKKPTLYSQTTLIPLGDDENIDDIF